MAEPELVQLPKALPESVTITQTSGSRFTPNELRRLKLETGKGLTELLGPGADDADKMQTLVWLRLTREGHVVKWEECADVWVNIEVEPDDPTKPGN